MGVKCCSVIFFLISLLSLSEAYRILAIFPLNSKSHNGMFNALIRGLAERNHQLDVITHFPLENPPENYKVIMDLSGTMPAVVNNFTYDSVTVFSENVINIVAELLGNNLCQLLALDEMQRLIKFPPKDPSYDLVITEALAAHCFMGFGHLFKVPVVALASTDHSRVNQIIGNSDNLAFVPDCSLRSRTFDQTNFWDRMKNFLTHHWNIRTFNSITGKTQTELMRKYMSPDMPDVREIEKSVALTLVNRHPLLNYAKPVTSSLIEVSGLHLEKVPTKLPSDLQKFLDDSTDGVVYFTMGSMVLIETFPENIIKTLYESFSKIAPIRVLMKVPNPELLPSGLPKNVITHPWMPQQAVLAHKNVKVFMTHGGMMSCQEALYHGKPILGIPLFADQPRNIEIFRERGMAVEIDINNLTSESLDNALSEILKNPKYRETTKAYSKLFKDRPASALETAIFWTEWVVRNDPKILKSPALQLKWWQLHLLDIYGFFLLTSIFLLYFLYSFVKLVFKIFFNGSKKIKIQ